MTLIDPLTDTSAVRECACTFVGVRVAKLYLFVEHIMIGILSRSLVDKFKYEGPNYQELESVYYYFDKSPFGKPRHI